MNLDEAGRLQDAWKTKHGDKPCHHARVIDYLTPPPNDQYTGKIVCRECGAIFPDPGESLPDPSSPH